MSYYFRLGQIPHKRHTQFRQPDGSLYHEELMGLHGFSGAKSLLYHLRPPTEVIAHRSAAARSRCRYAEQGPLRHRLLNTAALPPQGDAVQGRVPLMGNQDVTLSVVRPRDADGLLVSLRARRRGDLRARGHRRARESVRHVCSTARATTW